MKQFFDDGSYREPNWVDRFVVWADANPWKAQAVAGAATVVFGSLVGSLIIWFN